MPYLKVNNANLYYEEHGEGSEAIVFGHSMLFNLRMFDDQVDALKSSYRCILFDFRGQGKSEVTDGGYDLDNLALDTMELIRTLDSNPCHFIGFSMGGMVAMRIAARNPELIKSLVLIDTSSEPEPRKGYLRNKAMLGITWCFGPKPIAQNVMSMFFGPRFLKDKEKAEIMNYNIQNSELVTVPFAGHMSPVEEPVFVNDQIKNFLARISR